MGSGDVVSQLESWMAELARKWERYFAHDPQVPLPPEREREALHRRLREVSRDEARSAAAQFRLDQLLSRFATYNQHWTRQLRDREEATGGPQRVTHPVEAATNTPLPVSVSLEEAEYRRLYTAYSAALRYAGAASAPRFERFRDTLEQQRQAVAAKGALVESFEVVEEGGQVRVRARVRRGRQG